MSSPRDRLYSGLIYSLPLLVWTLGRLQQVETADTAQQLLRETAGLTPLLQALTLSVFIPWKRSKSGWYQALSSSLLLICVPWPLLALAWVAGAIGPLPLLLTQAALLVLAQLLTVASGRLTARSPEPHGWPLSLAGLQLGGVGLTLLLYQTWLPGILT